MKEKTTKFFSGPLMKQNIKSNWVLMIVIAAVMCMICVVNTYAMSFIKGSGTEVDVEAAQEDFYSYLYVMASYNEAAGTELSYEDFEDAEDRTAYEMAFEMLNQQSEDKDLSVEGLEETAEELEKSDVPLDTYVRQFEYVYALGQVQGCFSGEELDIGDMMDTMLEVMGVEAEKLETLVEMDTTAMFNQMDYSIIGLLPIFIFIVIVGNSLIANQVDKGSMAYILSTPTKRSAVANTQIIFMVFAPLIMVGVTCIARLCTLFLMGDEVDVAETVVLYLGMYLIVEALAGLCYLGSCFFDQSRKAMAFGGGITAWCFIASLLGMFGSEDMVSVGFGAEALNIFNKVTLVGLYDVKAITTIGSESVDTAFVWKFVCLAVIAVVCYVAGAVRFKKKDLPL